MGWAAGFRAGSDVARQAIQTYREAGLARDIEAAQKIAPEEIRAPAATQAQVDAATSETQALAAQDARDFGLGQPLQYNMPQVGQATAPSRFKLGNQMLDTAPTEQQIAGVRRKAMVDAMTRFDPVQGMRMGMELERDDRDRERFGWDRQAQPLRQRGLEQQTRAGEIQLGQSERALQVQGLVDEVAKMPTEALKAYAAKLNTNESNLPFLMVGESKDGYKFLTINPKSGRPMGKEFTVNDAQLRELAAASVLGMSGFGAESMQRLSAVNKDIADIVAKMNATTAQVVGSENDATSKGRADYFKQQGLNLDRERNSIARERNNLDRNPLQQKIDTIEKATGKKLTEAEIKALGGLKIDEPGGLKFNKTDDGVVFTDRRGNPVGKLDPALGLVPYGNDPRTDPRAVQELERKGVKIAVAQAADGTPIWAYASRDGRLFDNPQDALNPPMRKEDVGDLQGLRTLLDERRAQLVAAGRSGDQRVIAPLAQEVQGLQRTLTAAARERFGDRADEYLSN